MFLAALEVQYTVQGRSPQNISLRYVYLLEYRLSCDPTTSIQVFFYFSGHGATVGMDTVMYGDDGKAVSFYGLFHKEVTSKGAPVIAVLDCCRDTPGWAAHPSEVLVSV